MDATPGRHTQGPNPAPPDALPAYDKKIMSGRGPIQKKGSCLYHIVNSSGICSIAFSTTPTVKVIPEYMKAITGWDIDLDELLKTGERIANLRRLYQED
jgi:aldehyde:ferredoxin oxidoreductase